ncbi:sigma-70-like protein [Rhizobium sp. ERR 1071]|uniref:sigma factor n=1 Tax=Rhizobium sp. ERR 1071 TaxID=2572677 RepID=UPI00119B6AE5|nr:sigma-70-like protein [Rhizobium sp. ERR1071]
MSDTAKENTVIHLSRSNRLQAEVVELIPALRAFARTFHRNSTDADDLVQETLTKALANIDQFDPDTRKRDFRCTLTPTR